MTNDAQRQDQTQSPQTASKTECEPACEPAKVADKAQAGAKKIGAGAPQAAPLTPSALADVVAETSSDIVHAVTDLATEAAQNTMVMHPLIGVRPGNIADGGKFLLKAAATSPKSLVSHYFEYLQELGQIVTGGSDLTPNPKDRRFKDTAWKDNAFYRALLQSYLATQKQLGALVRESELDAHEKGQAQFFVDLVTDALAPSNWLLGNPAAVRKTLDTGGTNLVAGWKNFTHDMRENHMLPSQVDATPFKVGVNIATSPGWIVLRHEIFELIQYTPSTPEVLSRPLLMSPPQVNKFYAVDLTPDKSLVKWAVDSGVQLFIMSWRNPTAAQQDWSLESYVKAIDAAVEAVCEITGSPDINLWGTCSGGMAAAAYLGWRFGKGGAKVVNTTWAVCTLDTQAALDDSTLGLFNSPATIALAKANSRKKGVISGDEMASMFAWLRPNDLIWNYWVNNYLLGNQPPAYDILAWNADTTRLPSQFHCDLLDMVSKNPYIHPNTLEIDGVSIDMREVKVGAFVIGGLTDHITPWKACYQTAHLFGPDSMYVLANAGHLQSMINPPGVAKSFYFAGPALYDDATQWAKHNSTKQTGSWWLLWREWIQARSGALKAAPETAGSQHHGPICPAPGEYVFER